MPLKEVWKYRFSSEFWALLNRKYWYKQFWKPYYFFNIFEFCNNNSNFCNTVKYFVKTVVYVAAPSKGTPHCRYFANLYLAFAEYTNIQKLRGGLFYLCTNIWSSLFSGGLALKPPSLRKESAFPTIHCLDKVLPTELLRSKRKRSSVNICNATLHFILFQAPRQIAEETSFRIRGGLNKLLNLATLGKSFRVPFRSLFKFSQTVESTQSPFSLPKAGLQLSKCGDYHFVVRSKFWIIFYHFLNHKNVIFDARGNFVMILLYYPSFLCVFQLKLLAYN